MDWPGAEEMADRLKLMLPPQILEAESQEAPIPPEIQQAMQQVQQGHQELQAAQQEMQQFAQQLEAEKAANEAEKAKIEALKKEVESKRQILQSKYEELSAKLELQAAKLLIPVPSTIPDGPEEEAIEPEGMPPEMMMQSEPPQGGFFTPDEGMPQ
jgi:predicted nuclease with TOPRIM domain